jgi:hypothetical protein
MRLRQGRELVGTLRCVRCHSPGDLAADGAMPELSQDAPRLDDAGARLNAAWIARWVSDPKSVRPDATMPRLFHSGDAAAFELQHPTRMHCAAIPSILAVHQISLRFLIRCQTANRKPRKLPAMIKR